MTKGSIQNRDAFLHHIADKLGRERRTEVTRPEWQHQPQWDVYQNETQDDLSVIFQKNSAEKETKVFEAEKKTLPETIEKVLKAYGGGPMVTTKDPRFTEYSLTPVFENSETHRWDAALGEENIKQAKDANIGVIFSDISLAESGTVVQFNDKDIARSVCLLPTTYIAIVPKSTIVPRMTQATQKVHQQVESGEEIATCINFMSGPSNSADIEMDIVVGVHGPVKAVYIIVMDK